MILLNAYSYAWSYSATLIARVLFIVMVCVVPWLGTAPSHAQTGPQSLDATGQLIVDTIKQNCKQIHPINEQEFRGCAIQRYDAMRSFFAKLFHHRDTKGIGSNNFKRGIICLENASPPVEERGRKFAVERVDWISANACYETALRQPN